MYEPKYLKRWTMPDSYMGEVYPDYFVFLGRHRDSDLLSNCNFDVALEQLGGEQGDDVIIARASHWAVGWVESILILATAPQLKLADELAGALVDYPVLDDSAFSDAEDEERTEMWDSHGSYMVRDTAQDIFGKGSEIADAMETHPDFIETVRIAFIEDCFYRGNTDAWIGTSERLALHLCDQYTLHSLAHVDAEFLVSLVEVLKPEAA
jgi:hypothetical protein